MCPMIMATVKKYLICNQNFKYLMLFNRMIKLIIQKEVGTLSQLLIINKKINQNIYQLPNNRLKIMILR
jgi:hypothetical protein